MSLGFNQRAAVAASLEELAKDLDIPVYVEGYVCTPTDCEDMDPGEAARIVVDTVLDHPFVAAALEERESYWEALKWCALHLTPDTEIPDHAAAVMDAAMSAAATDYLLRPILGDE